MNLITINSFSTSLYKLFNKFEYERDREKDLIDSTLHTLKKGEVVIYLLQDENDLIGFIAVSASKLKSNKFSIPAIEIDYLFVDKRYRGKVLEKLNQKASIYLLNFVEDLAERLKQEIGLKGIILYPDMQDEKLIDFYSKIGFYK
jgi:GNAT superfamily N-acetyltransferase